jgi:hypothetical protein
MSPDGVARWPYTHHQNAEARLEVCIASVNTVDHRGGGGGGGGGVARFNGLE